MNLLILYAKIFLITKIIHSDPSDDGKQTE